MTTQDTTASEPRDYLAHWATTYGGGSWARDADPEKALKSCLRIAYSDWKHVFDLVGRETKITLFDVTGNDRVSVGAWGIEGDNPDAPITQLEVRVLRFPGKRKAS